MEPSEPALSPGLASSVGWSALAQGWNLIVSVLSAIILARLLLPQDFAVMAFIAPLLIAAQALQSFGMSSAIVNAKVLSKPQFDNALWLQLTVSLALTATLAFGGPWLARRVLGLDLSAEMAFIALAVVVASLAVQPFGLLMRALKFRDLALRTIAASTLAMVLGIGFALWLRNHWALLIPLVVVTVFNLVTAARLARWRPGLPQPSAGLPPALGFGLRVWAANLATVVTQHADNLIVAGATNLYQLGIYDRSYRVLAYPLGQAVLPLGQVLVPTLTRAVDDPPRYRAQFWRAASLLLLVCLPGLAVVATFPTTVIGVLLGPNWLEGGPLFGWFALAAMAEATLAMLGWLLHSQGRGQEIMRVGIFNAGIALASFGIGIAWGILGVATAFTLGRILICLPVLLWLTGRLGPVSIENLLSGLLPHGLALLTCIAVLSGLRAAFGPPFWPMLIASLAISYAVYLVVLLAIAPSRRLLWSAAAGLLKR